MPATNPPSLLIEILHPFTPVWRRRGPCNVGCQAQSHLMAKSADGICQNMHSRTTAIATLLLRLSLHDRVGYQEWRSGACRSNKCIGWNVLRPEQGVVYKSTAGRRKSIAFQLNLPQTHSTSCCKGDYLRQSLHQLLHNENELSEQEQNGPDGQSHATKQWLRQILLPVPSRQLPEPESVGHSARCSMWEVHRMLPSH
jgi:hypothetical protein